LGGERLFAAVRTKVGIAAQSVFFCAIINVRLVTLPCLQAVKIAIRLSGGVLMEKS
jgi:hypothetical protein